MPAAQAERHSEDNGVRPATANNGGITEYVHPKPAEHAMAKARKGSKKLKDLKGKGKTVSKKDATTIRGGVGSALSDKYHK